MNTATATPGQVNLDATTLNATLATRIAMVDEQIATLQAERKQLADSLAYRLPIGKSVLDDMSVTVSTVNTYDGDAFMALLRPGQQQRVTTRTLDRAKAKAAYPTLWESVKETKGRKVSVK